MGGEGGVGGAGRDVEGERDGEGVMKMKFK